MLETLHNLIHAIGALKTFLYFLNAILSACIAYGFFTSKNGQLRRIMIHLFAGLMVYQFYYYAYFGLGYELNEHTHPVIYVAPLIVFDLALIRLLYYLKKH